MENERKNDLKEKPSEAPESESFHDEKKLEITNKDIDDKNDIQDISQESSTIAQNLSDESTKTFEDDETKKILESTVIETNKIEKEAIKDIGISEEIISEKFKSALETQKPKAKKKSAILNIIMLIINIALISFISKNLISNLENRSILSVFAGQGNKIWWLFGGLLMYGVYMFLQVIMYRVLIKNLSGRKSWKISYDVAVVGKYYDSITPFTFGGQSIQILRLTSNGIGAGVATSIPILKIMITSGINALLALLFFVFGIPLIPKTSILNDILTLLLEIVGVIGLIITVLIALFILLISSGTIVTKTIISGLLRLGYKLRIIKDYRTTYKKVMNQVTEYKFSMSYLMQVLCFLFQWRFQKISAQVCLCFWCFALQNITFVQWQAWLSRFQVERDSWNFRSICFLA